MKIPKYKEQIINCGLGKLFCICLAWWHFWGYLPFVRGIHRSPVNSPHKGQWCGALMFSLICTWINGWVDNREVGDLRRHCAHYDVRVMVKVQYHLFSLSVVDMYTTSQSSGWLQSRQANTIIIAKTVRLSETTAGYRPLMSSLRLLWFFTYEYQSR